MRQSRNMKRLSYMVAGAICLSSVTCLPNSDQLRGLVQASILGVVQAGITAVIDTVIPSYDNNDDTNGT